MSFSIKMLSIKNRVNKMAPLLVIFFTLSTLHLESVEGKKMTYPLLMPHVRPTVKDTYFCTAFKMPRHEHEYIVEFEPNATSNTAHHILIYGCSLPGYYERDSPRAIWDCGEMAEASTEYSRAPTCASGSTILYAWAKDAPKLVLPPGVGFKVGGDSKINFLVLQVHYAHVDKFLNGATDDSGIILSMLPSDTPLVNKRAGVLLLGTGGSIKHDTVEHMETSCEIREPITLHPFAFRTHTHKLGTAVSGWKVDSESNWHLIGRHDPQAPQMFYPVQDTSMVIRQGDMLAARCTMKNTLHHDVAIGSTGNDEMCNFYLMYFTDGDQTLHTKYCFSPGPPRYHWDTDALIGTVPKVVDDEASKL